mmetsp:Transcript_34946/g.68803  ORF Transcript_34946/g.68803 Transcript_34946/m.68803 type:complete len:230 (-) Transcript_34946:36-725(-)
MPLQQPTPKATAPATGMLAPATPIIRAPATACPTMLAPVPAPNTATLLATSLPSSLSTPSPRRFAVIAPPVRSPTAPAEPPVTAVASTAAFTAAVRASARRILLSPFSFTSSTINCTDTRRGLSIVSSSGRHARCRRVFMACSRIFDMLRPNFRPKLLVRCLRRALAFDILCPVSELPSFEVPSPSSCRARLMMPTSELGGNMICCGLTVTLNQVSSPPTWWELTPHDS